MSTAYTIGTETEGKKALYNPEREHKEIYHATNSVPPTQQLLVDCIKEVLDFPNLVPVPFETGELLTEEEKAFHASMSLFHTYWKRSISFPNDNTKKLLHSQRVADG